MRIEHDGLGELMLPDEAYYGSVAERHRVAFDVGLLHLMTMRLILKQLL